MMSVFRNPRGTGELKEAEPAGVEAHGSRAEIHRGSLTEWYVNDERGLEQGFTLEERPAGTAGDELVLELELTGDLMPLVAGNGRRLDLLRPGDPLPVVVYSGLTVEYTLTDEESDPALRIVPEYSVGGGADWQPATEGPGGSGTTSLPADADGRDHTFVWDSYADAVRWGHDVRFRITVPHQASLQVGGPIQRGAMSAASPPFRICDIPADVAVTKDDGVTQVALGQLLTYTITVSHNAGLADANAVRVIDDFPAGLGGIFWNCLEDGGGGCSAASGSGDIDTFVDLPVGTYVTFVAVGTVTAAGGDGVTNTVEVQASLVAPDPNPANNTATDVDQGWTGIFADGFETGDVSQWSASTP
jgi:uncharacterized repeat protein (TIGR01451 family)